MIEQMARGMGKMMMANFGTEVLYSFVIIACSLMIYFGTKELYEISSHKGIKYFRLTFLFFAFAYFSRSFIKLILSYFNAPGLNTISPNLLHPMVGTISLLLFIYFSIIAIFYLLYSIMWKKFGESKSKTYLLHIISFLLAFAIVFFRNLNLYLAINIFLFLIVLLVIIFSQKSSHKHGLYTSYLLLSFFWILNILEMLIPMFLVSYKLLIYLISSGIFMLISYKVLKRTCN